MTIFSKFATAITLATTLSPQIYAVSTTSTKSTHSSTAAHSKSGKHHHARKPRGQQAIEPGRVSEIQSALVKAGYIKGEPSGQWDASTISAMQKYQADNNWQTKLMPDSRALIKLGLGPDYSNAVNAKGLSFLSSDAQPLPAAATPQAAGFTEASGVRQ